MPRARVPARRTTESTPASAAGQRNWTRKYTITVPARPGDERHLARVAVGHRSLHRHHEDGAPWPRPRRRRPSAGPRAAPCGRPPRRPGRSPGRSPAGRCRPAPPPPASRGWRPPTSPTTRRPPRRRSPRLAAVGQHRRGHRGGQHDGHPQGLEHPEAQRFAPQQPVEDGGDGHQQAVTAGDLGHHARGGARPCGGGRR